MSINSDQRLDFRGSNHLDAFVRRFGHLGKVIAVPEPTRANRSIIGCMINVEMTAPGAVRGGRGKASKAAAARGNKYHVVRQRTYIILARTDM